MTNEYLSKTNKAVGLQINGDLMTRIRAIQPGVGKLMGRARKATQEDVITRGIANLEREIKERGL